MTNQDNQKKDISPQKQTVKYCSNCGAEVLKTAVICVKCGHTLQEYHRTSSNFTYEAPWSGFAMFLLVIGTLFIPFFGFAMGLMSLQSSSRRSQGITLIVLEVIRIVVIILIIVTLFANFYRVPNQYRYYY